MKDELKKIIQDALLKMNISKSLDEIGIEVPKTKGNGDYSSNIAMQLTKELSDNPINIANEIVKNISGDFVEYINVAKPGFINFNLKRDFLTKNITKVLTENESYGKSNIGYNQRVNVEYVSANPTGILHLGHARGASYGDNLTRILKFAGYDVTREYYINDAGNQILNLAKSVEARYNEICGFESKMPEDGYYGKEIIEVAKILYQELGNEVKDINIFRKYGLDYLLNQIKQDLMNFRTSFDIWSSEQALYDNNEVEKILGLLKKTDYVYELDGATWLKTTAFGDEKDRVLVKSDNTNTYLLPDIAYHKIKYSRGYDMLIDVLGADHHGYVSRLKASMAIMGENPDKLFVEILQMVRLLRSGEEVKMSKRTGNAVTINELVEEVGIDATRYFFAMRSPDSQMDFDLDLATKKSNENPVYYVQYAYARIQTILNDYNKFELINNFKTIDSDYAYNLLAKIYAFKETVEVSAIKKEPHIITNYVYDLAGLFHSYYAHEKVLSDDLVYTMERINLIKATAITIKNALNLIGVATVDKM